MSCNQRKSLFAIPLSLACGLVFLTAAFVTAQDPFGDAPPAGAAPDAFGQAEPAATDDAKNADAKKTPNKQIGKKASEPIVPRQYPLAVEAVLESKPRTPADLVRASATLINLGEPELAKPFIERLQTAQLEDAQLSEIIRQLGAAPLLKIAGEPALKPEGAAFADRALAASAKVARDTARLAQLVEQLGDPSLGRQQQAAAALLNAHEYAAFPLVRALERSAKASNTQARLRHARRTRRRCGAAAHGSARFSGRRAPRRGGASAWRPSSSLRRASACGSCNFAGRDRCAAPRVE